MIDDLSIAVVGATGNVGRLLINILSYRQLPVKRLYAISNSSIGHKITFGSEDIITQPIRDFDFTKVSLVFTCVSADVARDIIPVIVNAGSIVIDKSHHFRMHPQVPLIIPEVNFDTIPADPNIISSPNCCVIPLMLVLKPLDEIAHIKRIIISTYQSTSGAGKDAIDELCIQTKAYFTSKNLQIQHNVFPKQIAFNIIPQIGQLLQNGDSEEEDKIIKEVSKIIGRQVPISVTCVRVPTFFSHACSVNVEFEHYISAQEAADILAAFKGIKVQHNSTTDCDDNSLGINTTEKSILDNNITTPIDTTNRDEVFVSRIRQDRSVASGLNFLVTADNLRKGAALNAVQIAEQLISNNII